MFKISTKGDYGLLLLSALAEEYAKGEVFIALKEIAKKKHLSLPYISQIILPLKNAGLVMSKEGKHGGYRLAREPSKITMMEVLEILEGPVSPVRCCDNKAGKCGSESYCNVKFTWQDAKNLLIYFLKNKTLADTVKPHHVPH
jgi:Rrf2 family protein